MEVPEVSIGVAGQLDEEYIRGLEKKNSDVVIKTIRINDEKGDPD